MARMPANETHARRRLSRRADRENLHVGLWPIPAQTAQPRQISRKQKCVRILRTFDPTGLKYAENPQKVPVCRGQPVAHLRCAPCAPCTRTLRTFELVAHLRRTPGPPVPALFSKSTVIYGIYGEFTGDLKISAGHLWVIYGGPVDIYGNVPRAVALTEAQERKRGAPRTPSLALRLVCGWPTFTLRRG